MIRLLNKASVVWPRYHASSPSLLVVSDDMDLGSSLLIEVTCLVPCSLLGRKRQYLSVAALLPQDVRLTVVLDVKFVCG